jgi:hypothetical protein
LIASFIDACDRNPKRATWFRKLKAHAHPDIGHGIKWKDTQWHRFEIQHYRFRRYMERLIRKFGTSGVRRGEPRIMQIEGSTEAEPPLKAAS